MFYSQLLWRKRIGEFSIIISKYTIKLEKKAEKGIARTFPAKLKNNVLFKELCGERGIRTLGTL